jgi:hypothetical protein
MASYTDRKDDYLTRLCRIEGQVRGLQRMVEAATPGRPAQRRRSPGKRAERIQEWPFDEATFARVVTIASQRRRRHHRLAHPQPPGFIDASAKYHEHRRP